MPTTTTVAPDTHVSIERLRNAARPLNCTVRLRDGEYRLNHRNGSEDTAYYTNDSRDALATLYLMVRSAN